jgi:SAM-dependent methyltransferase
MADYTSLRRARDAYDRGENVMRLFRNSRNSDRNDADAVLVAYDLQAGSYRAQLDEPRHRDYNERYTAAIAPFLDDLAFDSLLDAGTGEATTLMALMSRLAAPPSVVSAFDVSWSRVAHARAHASEFDVPAPELFVADLFRAPCADRSFDLVLTTHALEPNGGREEEGIAELARIARKWLVLCEPSYELGGPNARAHIQKHGYVCGLPETAERLGLRIVRHELIEPAVGPNRTAVLVLGVEGDSPAAPDGALVCPLCRGALDSIGGHLFCRADGVVFPLLDGIACLDPRDAIVASKYGDVAGA